jgi:hypothetical protein
MHPNREGHARAGRVTPGNPCRAGIALTLAAGIAAGCGSGSDDSANEAQKVVQQLKSLQKGDILIQGFSAPRVLGPYQFKPGGYVFSYRQNGGAGLRVALESKSGSRRQPYQLLVDSDQTSGRSSVALAGKLYVHVLEADGEYMLRFRPKRR